MWVCAVPGNGHVCAGDSIEICRPFCSQQGASPHIGTIMAAASSAGPEEATHVWKAAGKLLAAGLEEKVTDARNVARDEGRTLCNDNESWNISDDGWNGGDYESDKETVVWKMLEGSGTVTRYGAKYAASCGSTKDDR